MATAEGHKGQGLLSPLKNALSLLPVLCLSTPGQLSGDISGYAAKPVRKDFLWRRSTTTPLVPSPGIRNSLYNVIFFSFSQVRTTLENSRDYKIEPLSQEGNTASVCANERKTSMWTIIPQKLGKLLCLCHSHGTWLVCPVSLQNSLSHDPLPANLQTGTTGKF